MHSKLRSLMIAILAIAFSSAPLYAQGDKYDDYGDKAHNRDTTIHGFDGWFAGWFDADGYLKAVDDARPIHADVYRSDDANAQLPIPDGWQGIEVNDNLLVIRKEKFIDMNSDETGYDNRYREETPELMNAAFSMFVQGKGSVFNEYTRSDVDSQKPDELKETVKSALQEETAADEILINNISHEEVNRMKATVIDGKFTTRATNVDMGDYDPDYTATVNGRLYMFPTDGKIVHVIYLAPADEWDTMKEFAEDHIQHLQLPNYSPEPDEYKAPGELGES